MSVWMDGSYKTRGLQLKRAMVKEKLSTLTQTTIEFSANADVDLKDILGKVITLYAKKDVDGTTHKFTGTCISVENLGLRDTMVHCVAEVRPWFWMLTLTKNNRVFQERSTQEIIKEVLDDHTFSDVKFIGKMPTKKREYCVQYRESDFDFVSRLMEEEGLYYFFKYDKADKTPEQLIICNQPNAHEALDPMARITFKPRDPSVVEPEQNMTEWSAERAVTRGTVRLVDYDFENPSVRQMVMAKLNAGDHAHSKYEKYDIPGHFRSDDKQGKAFAEFDAESTALRQETFRGAGNVRCMYTGGKFTLAGHQERSYNKEYLVTEAVHYFEDGFAKMKSAEREQKRKADGPKFDRVDEWHALDIDGMKFPENLREDYSFTIGAILKATQFRAPKVTPWPQVPSLQTGVVVASAGNQGKEIDTDKYGRVRVLFRWDLGDEKKRNASCWIRVVTPWSGNNWGMNAVPRIGQEVVIQFEDGDPDRPIVTGMLYNAETMPPYVDPDTPTRTGIKTHSSPDGGKDMYNALLFEDDIDKEYLHIQAQKDYQMVVKNGAEIRIGDPKDLIDDTKQDAKESSLNLTVKKDYIETVKEGDRKTLIEKGLLETTVQKGNMSEIVSKGDFLLDAKAGEITLQAAKKITLKVGDSTITLTPTGIEIKAGLKVEVSSTTTKVSGSAALDLKGGMVKIN